MIEDQNTNRLPAEDAEYQLGQLPCRCGEVPRAMSLRDEGFNYYYYVECAVCKRVGGADSTINGAIRKWNAYVSGTNPIAGR